ncbi:MAG: TetR/AcrR family transcriptional regulator [Alphaproteobacteria bacterium]|nr:TetR/AcrR family transcriptional regulator [Alphaproteobacteria bacterium]
MAERKAKKSKSTKRRATEVPLDRQILDATLVLAEEIGWDGLRLRRVAERLGVPLAEVLVHYRDLDVVANAWFRRAWVAMLESAPEGFAARPARERLHLMMMRWFDTLAPHREVTGQILAAKLYPSHPHHWMPLVFNLSRSIHWLREAALLDAVGRRRQMEEVGLTALFLMTLAVWLRDETPGQAHTRNILRHRLADADRAMVRVWGPAPPPGTAEAA